MLQQQSLQVIEPGSSLNTTSQNTETISEKYSEMSPIKNFSSVLENLPKNDFSQLIDLNNFKFLINHKICEDYKKNILLIILVHSAPDNSQQRKVIRETWGGLKEYPRILLIFLIAAVKSSVIQNKIDLESNVHQDLVQGNFQDAYRNMTYKHVMGLKWFLYFCPTADFVLKVIYLNMPRENFSDQFISCSRWTMMFLSTAQFFTIS